jgi:hypothetical protein
MENCCVEYVIYVYYLDDNNIRQWEKIVCDSLVIAEQRFMNISERGLTMKGSLSEYENSVTVKRYIPHHRILHIDYVKMEYL